MFDEIEPNVCQDTKWRGGSHVRFDKSACGCRGACHEHWHRIRRNGQDQYRRCASQGAQPTSRAYSQSFRRHAGECRPLLARLVWCNLEQIWRLCAGECTPIPESPDSWSTRNSGLSALSLQSGPLPDGRRLLRRTALCGHQPELLSLAPFSIGAGEKPLPLHAIHISRPQRPSGRVPDSQQLRDTRAGERSDVTEVAAQ